MHVTLILGTGPMKVMCGRTTLIPWLYTFSLRHKGFGYHDRPDRAITYRSLVVGAGCRGSTPRLQTVAADPAV
ncbi:hypothetical protein GCM10010199_64070 [Dactylosporangium roseum]